MYHENGVLIIGYKFKNNNGMKQCYNWDPRGINEQLIYNKIKIIVMELKYIMVDHNMMVFKALYLKQIIVTNNANWKTKQNHKK